MNKYSLRKTISFKKYSSGVNGENNVVSGIDINDDVAATGGIHEIHSNLFHQKYGKVSKSLRADVI